MEVDAPLWIRCMDHKKSWSWQACKVVARKPRPSGKTEVTLGRETRDHGLLPEDHPDWESREVMVNLKTMADDEDDDVEDAIRYRNEPGRGGIQRVEDLVALPHLNEASILTTLRYNLSIDEVYTSNGPTLLALNPFKAMSIYSLPVLKAYQKAGASSNPNDRMDPHCFRVADDAFRSMILALDRNKATGGGDTANQSILISGESGAGKTYTTKLCMKYLAVLSEGMVSKTKKSSAANVEDATLSPKKAPSASGSRRDSRRASLVAAANPLDQAMPDDISVEERILQSNPILESFGNALTLRNDNSSRFGKYLEIKFDKTGLLLGAQVRTYLLEKVRLVPSRDGSSGPGERNYHVFYQFLAGMKNSERNSYGVTDDMSAKDFKILSMTSNSYTRYRDNVPDTTVHADMVEGMGAMGFSGQLIADIIQTTYAVLFLGNVEFESGNVGGEGESSTLKRDKWAETACKLLTCSMDDFENSVCFSTKKIGKDVVKKPLKPDIAKLANEAFMKALYSCVFDLTTEAVNRSIASFDGTGDGILRVGDNEATIGVLDIFGFEHFKVNSFEQLCINLANESLQQKFNETVFLKEQEEYVSEGISWANVDFPSNDDILELINSRKPRTISLFAVLNEQCLVPKGSDKKFASALYTNFDNDKFSRFIVTGKQKVELQFTVEHFAGKVTYDSDGFLEKNKDSIGDAVTILSTATLPFLGEEIKGRLSKLSTNIKDNAIARKFTKQLAELRGKIDTTQTSFIRCLKPNNELVPDNFDSLNVVEQLRSSGVLAAVRVSRAGFSNRLKHNEFVSRYHMLMDNHGKDTFADSKDSLACMDHNVATVAKKINHHEKVVDADEFAKMSGTEQQIAIGMQLGKTKVFMKRKAFDQIESTRTETVTSSVLIMQNFVRGRISRALFLKFKAKVVLSQTIVRMFLGKCRLAAARKAYELKIAHKTAAAIVIQRYVRSRATRRKWVATILETLRLSKIATSDLEAEIAKKKEGEYLAAVALCDPAIQDDLTVLGNAGLTEATVVHLSKRTPEEQKKACAALKKSQSAAASPGKSTKKLFGKSKGGKRQTANAALVAILAENAREDKKESMKRAKSRPTLQPDARDATTLEKDKAAREREMANWSLEKKLAQRDGNLPPALFVPSSPVASELGLKIEAGEFAAVEQMLKDGGEDIVFAVEEGSLETPLHIAARKAGCWASIIEMIIANGRGIEFQQDRSGWTPFHIAAYSDETNENLENIVASSKDERKGVSIANEHGELPLHVASKGGAKHNVMVLCGIYGREGCSTKDAKGNTPLHASAGGRGGANLMLTLVKNFPEAADDDNAAGKTPLRLALESELFDPSIIKALVSSAPDAVSADDLFLAIEKRVSGEGLKILLVRYTGGEGATDVMEPLSGQPLLHYALAAGAHDDCITQLIEFNKVAAREVDGEDRLPVEIAVEKSYSDAAVGALLEATAGYDGVFARSWFHLNCNAKDAYADTVEKHVLGVEDKGEKLRLFKICCLGEEMDFNKLSVSLSAITENEFKHCKATPRCLNLLKASFRLHNRYELDVKIKVDKRSGTELVIAEDFGAKGDAKRPTSVVLKLTHDLKVVQDEVAIRKALCTVAEGMKQVKGLSSVLARIKNVHVKEGEATIAFEKLDTIVSFVSKYKVKTDIVRKWGKSIGSLIDRLNRGGYYYEELNMANAGRDVHGNWKLVSGRSVKKLSMAPKQASGKSPVRHKEVYCLLRVLVLLYGLPKELKWDIQGVNPKNNKDIANLLETMNSAPRIPATLKDVVLSVATDKSIVMADVLKMAYFKPAKAPSPQA